MARRNGTGSIKPCLECGRLIRPNTWKADKHPGTLTHAGNGLCSRCLTRKQKAKIKKEQQDRGPANARMSTEQNAHSLETYIAGRRERLAVLDRIVDPRKALR